MPNCVICGATTIFGQVCAMCGLKAKHGALNKALKDAQQPQGGATPVAAWITTAQKKSTLIAANVTALSKTVDDYIGAVMGCLAKHINDNAASSFGDQTTLWNNPNVSTTSVDYQGTRSTQGQCWIDIQGQCGGGSTKRKSYFQVMVQTQRGTPPPCLVRQAIRESLGSGMRVVIHDNTTAPPL